MAKTSTGGGKERLSDVISTSSAQSAQEEQRIKKLLAYKAGLEKKNAQELAKLNEKLQKDLNSKDAAVAQKAAETLAKKKQKQAEKDQKTLAAIEKRQHEEQAKIDREEARAVALELTGSLTAGQALEKFKDNLSESLSAAFSKVGAKISDGVEKYMGVYSNYMAGINTRLQDSGLDFESLNDIISDNTMLSPFVAYTDVVENLNKLVDAGVADNVAQRAFLSTISDKIATTFDAAQASLLEIVRIQQEDSTAARLGLEADLTGLFNYYFSDTSYLSNTFDSVQAAMVDLSSQLNASDAISIEYIIQKWLGSLGSVGVANNTLTSIASALTALGAGDLNALSSNGQMQNLLVMAAKRSDLDFGQMLTQGFTGDQLNSLLSSLILFVQEIAESSNNVVKAQYADLFGLTIADMSAFQNLSTAIINDLASFGMTYEQSIMEVNEQLSTVSSRMHLSEKINNLLDNAMAAVGTNIASMAGTYIPYQAMSVLESVTGGIDIPAINVLGSGVDLKTTVEDLAQAAIIGFSAIGPLYDAVRNLGNASSSLADWTVVADKSAGYSAFLSAGTKAQTTSSTTYVANTSDTGMQQAMYDEGSQQAKKVAGTEEADSELLVILKWLQDYFITGAASTAPLQVAVRSLPNTNSSTLG